MNPTIVAYVVYLTVSIAITVWVGQTLHKNGRIFLVEAFRGDETLADSVNHLLIVGFYLLNIGFVTLAMRAGITPTDVGEVFELVATKVGVVMLVLGVVHFFNVWLFNRMRRHAQLRQAPPPVDPSGLLANVSAR